MKSAVWQEIPSWNLQRVLMRAGSLPGRHPEEKRPASTNRASARPVADDSNYGGMAEAEFAKSRRTPSAVFSCNKQTGMLHRLLHTGTCSSVVREAGKPNWTCWSNRHGWARFDPDAVRFRTYSSTSGHPVRLRLCIHRVPPLCSTVYCHLPTVGELPACLASECSWCACQNWQQEVVL